MASCSSVGARVRANGSVYSCDAGMIAAAQAVEHYEITRYGTLRRWAKMLGMDEAASLLEQTLTEESETDDLLTQIADAGANKEALAEAKGDS